MTPHVFHQTFSKIFNFIEMYLYIRKNIIISIKKLSLCNRIMIHKTIQSFKVLKTWEMKKGNCRETEGVNLKKAFIIVFY